MSQSRSVKSLVLLPLINKSPEVYLSKPPTMFNKVVLPQPEGPKIDTNSFFLNEILKPFKASTLVSPAIYTFLIFY